MRYAFISKLSVYIITVLCTSVYINSWIKLCKQICEVMVKYLENSNYKSLNYLVKDKFLNILLDKVWTTYGQKNSQLKVSLY